MQELEKVIHMKNYRYFHIRQYGPSTRNLLDIKERAIQSQGAVGPLNERYLNERDDELTDIGKMKHFFILQPSKRKSIQYCIHGIYFGLNLIMK